MKCFTQGNNAYCLPGLTDRTQDLQDFEVIENQSN